VADLVLSLEGRPFARGRLDVNELVALAPIIVVLDPYPGIVPLWVAVELRNLEPVQTLPRP